MKLLTLVFLTTLFASLANAGSSQRINFYLSCSSSSPNQARKMDLFIYPSLGSPTRVLIFEEGAGTQEWVNWFSEPVGSKSSGCDGDVVQRHQGAGPNLEFQIDMENLTGTGILRWRESNHAVECHQVPEKIIGN